MLDFYGFKEKVGVTKNEYVQEWLDNNLIPGAVKGDKITDAKFLDSSRRPYRSRWLKSDTDADKVRAHIVKACINRQHITKETCHASKGEFDGFIAELEKADLLRIRIEDGIEYYDSTLKSSAYANRSLNEIKSFVIEALKAVSEGAAKGATAAILEKVS